MQHGENGEVLLCCHFLQCTEHLERGRAVQARSRFIQCNKCWIRDQFHAYIDPFALPARDPPLLWVTDDRVDDILEPEKFDDVRNHFHAVCSRHRRRQSQFGLVRQHLTHLEVGVHDVVLGHKSADGLELLKRLLPTVDKNLPRGLGIGGFARDCREKRRLPGARGAHDSRDLACMHHARGAGEHHFAVGLERQSEILVVDGDRVLLGLDAARAQQLHVVVIAVELILQRRLLVARQIGQPRGADQTQLDQFGDVGQPLAVLLGAQPSLQRGHHLCPEHITTSCSAQCTAIVTRDRCDVSSSVRQMQRQLSRPTSDN
eukprot:m.114540 g.114540  ORF g.114540 m.114540 type:complete len:317 (-) comp17117_c0_seq22:1943-2893(-)